MKIPLLTPIATAVCAATAAAVLAPAAAALPPATPALPGPVDPGSGGASAAQPRPDEGATVTAYAPYDAYAAPAATFASGRAVVHYAAAGRAAPPPGDADSDGAPDYVERVAQAADVAITYFERRGFPPIAPDAGGPSPAPDIYVSSFETGVLAVAYPSVRGRGGAFVVVSNTLSTVSAGACTASLDATVAHELFHLVQFSHYASDLVPALPGWVSEGSAGAIEARLYPLIADRVTGVQLTDWFRQTEQPLSNQSYGSQLFWRYVDERYPGVLPAVLRELSAHPSLPSRGVVAATFSRVTGRPFGPTFHRFGLGVADAHRARIKPLLTLSRRGAGYLGVVQPFALHYVRLRVAATRPLVLTLTFARREEAVRATVVYGGQAARRIAGRASGRKLVFNVPAKAFRGGTALLVVSNAAATRGLNYRAASW